MGRPAKYPRDRWRALVADLGLRIGALEATVARLAELVRLDGRSPPETCQMPYTPS